MSDTPQVGYEPAIVDLIVQQGDRWEQNFYLFDTFIAWGDPGNVVFNATGYNARMQVRNRPIGSQAATTIADLSDDIVGGNNKIIWVDRITGHFRALLTKAETAVIPIVSEKVNPTFPVTSIYWYDVELFKQDGSYERKIFRGAFKVKGEITLA